jgi:PAS domain S-box-containing protein/diguanylate cyclase (GGDEF)-like protein
VVNAGWPSIPIDELPHVLLRAVGAAAHGITIGDASPDRRLVYVNDAFVRMTGYPAEEVLGLNCRFLQGPGTDPSSVSIMCEALATGRDASTVLLNFRKDGTPFWNEVSISAVRNPAAEITHYIGTQIDVTERVQREQEIARLARADPLTGLSNRSELTGRVDGLIAAMPADDGLALVFVDLDGFHTVNADFDFETGNLLLVEIARRLSALSRPDDLLCRLEADRFVLVRLGSRQQGGRIAQTLVDQVHAALLREVELRAVRIPIGAHTGFAVFPDDGNSAAALLHAARRAMESDRGVR